MCEQFTHQTAPVKKKCDFFTHSPFHGAPRWEDANNERRYDYLPPDKSQRPVREIKDPVLIAMQDKPATEESKAI